MDIVDLPLIDYEAPVKLALERLQEASRSALVTQGELAQGELTILIIEENFSNK